MYKSPVVCALSLFIVLYQMWVEYKKSIFEYFYQFNRDIIELCNSN